MGASLAAAATRTGSIAPRQQTNFRRRVIGRPGGPAGRPDHGPARCDARRAAHALPTRGGAEHAVAGDRSAAGSPSKKTVHADEQRRPDIAAARRQWRDWQPLRDVRQYVFLDECGVATDLLRRYGRSPRGTRLHDHTPCGQWQTHTVVAALRLTGLTAPAVFNGPIDNRRVLRLCRTGPRPDPAAR